METYASHPAASALLVVRRITAGGAGDDRDRRGPRLGLEPARELEAAAVGQVQIDHDHRRLLLGQRLLGGRERVRGADLVALEFEQPLEQPQVELVIVDDQHASLHDALIGSPMRELDSRMQD